MHAAPTDNDVRLFVYLHLVSACRAPTIAEAARALEADPARIRASYRALAEGHVLVLHPDTDEIRMAMPFSAVRTNYTVTAGESSWWAN
jgi:hypothetical protein